MDGYTDEDHLISAIWNLCGLAWTEEKRPEMMDIPSRLHKLEDRQDKCGHVTLGGINYTTEDYTKESTGEKLVYFTESR